MTKKKFPNVKIFDAGTIEGIDATNLRLAIVNNNEEEIAKYIPDGISVDEFLQTIGEQVKEKPAETPPDPQKLNTEVEATIGIVLTVTDVLGPSHEPLFSAT